MKKEYLWILAAVAAYVWWKNRNSQFRAIAASAADRAIKSDLPLPAPAINIDVFDSIVKTQAPEIVSVV